MDEYRKLRAERGWGMARERLMLFRYILARDEIADFVEFCREEVELEDVVDELTEGPGENADAD